jgi:uncharacterized protein YndB with AHSA1/START domain
MTHPSVKLSQLIRRSAADVFDAFVNPETITKFWLESASAPLAAGARVDWRFMVPGAAEVTSVTRFDPPSALAFDWSDGISVSLTFEAHTPGITRITLEASGFQGDDVLDQAVNASEGFTLVLCDLKTLLETGQSTNLVRDKAQLIVETHTTGDSLSAPRRD